VLGRFIPTLLLGGGLALGAGPTIDLIKGTVTRSELVSIKDALIEEWMVVCRPPPLDGLEFENFILDIMREQDDRDVTKDHWGSTYRIAETGDKAYVLYSLGANQFPDGCGYARTVSSEDLEDAPPGAGARDSDDVCVSLKLGRCESAMRPLPP